MNGNVVQHDTAYAYGADGSVANFRARAMWGMTFLWDLVVRQASFDELWRSSPQASSIKNWGNGDFVKTNLVAY